MISFRHALGALLLVLSGPASSFAQTGQYTAPGQLGVEQQKRSEGLKNAIDEARWNLGGLRVDPWIALRDVSIVNDEAHDGDLTASVGAGLRAYLPVGSRLVLATHLLPNYIWWLDAEEDSRLAGRYGVGAFYQANRLAGEITATYVDQDALASAEVNRRVGVEDRDFNAHFDIPFAHRFGSYLQAHQVERDVADPQPGLEDLGNLSQTTAIYEAGLYWNVNEQLRFSVGGGQSETDFDENAVDRSNEGDFVSARVQWTRTKTRLQLTVRDYDLQPKPGSSFAPYASTTWQGQLFWNPNDRFSAALYGERGLAYSVLVGESSYLDERIGLRLAMPFGSRLLTNVFAETGAHDYFESGRNDDVTSFGGAISFRIYKQIRLGIHGRSTRTEPQIGEPFTNEELGFRLSFGGLGEEHSGWY